MIERMNTGRKIAASFVLAFGLLLAMGAVALVGTQRMSRAINDFSHRRLPSLSALAQVDDAKTGVQLAVGSLLLPRGDAALRAQARASIADGLKAIDAGAAAYEAVPHRAETLELWRQAKAAMQVWRAKVDALLVALDERSRLLAEGKGPDDPAVAAVDARAWPLFVATREALSAVDVAVATVSERTIANGAIAEREGDEVVRGAVAMTTAALLVGLALLGVLGVVLSRSVGRAIRAVVREAAKLRDGIAAGRLDVRGDAGVVAPEYRPIVEGMNETMDAYARPLAMTVDYVTRISRGDIPPRITDEYRGDFNRIKDAFNACIATVGALLEDAGTLARAAVEGHLGTRADAARHQGAFRDLVQGVNSAIGALVDHIDAMPAPAMVVGKDLRVRYMNAVALKVAGRERAQVLGQRCADVFRTTDCDTDRCACARAIRENRVVQSDTVARPSTGEYEIDYFGVPIRDGQEVVGAFEVITDQTAVKRTMRTMHKVAAFQGRCTTQVVEALEALSRGDPSVRVAMDAGDADTAEAAQAFAAIGAAITRSAEAVRAMAREAGVLVQAAIEGRLSTRADASRLEGEFRTIVEGVNRTLDAVIAPIDESAAALERIAQRDLRARVTGTFLGDHARIQGAVNASAQALHDALTQVADAVDQVSSAAAQIASSSQAVASGASEQAASLEQTSGAVDSVSSLTRRSAEGAARANALSQSARAAAAEGASSVDQMQAAMDRIKASAEGTSQIIRDINDIAFQTNLLALNAAVEAARAGEAGRGFAVVAEEVRSLALRAKEAATRTEELIRQAVQEAAAGATTARHVAGTLGQIVEGVGKVTDIISEIAATARDQTSGIEQVGRAVDEMNKVTQQNAASAEESSSAASELSGQAEELAAMVGAFQIDRAAAAQARRGAEPVARSASRRDPGPRPVAASLVASARAPGRALSSTPPGTA